MIYKGISWSMTVYYTENETSRFLVKINLPDAPEMDYLTDTQAKVAAEAYIDGYFAGKDHNLNEALEFLGPEAVNELKQTLNPKL